MSLSAFQGSSESPEEAGAVAGQELPSARTTAWSFGAGSQPPLAPKGLNRGGSSANLSSVANGASSGGTSFKAAGASNSLNAATGVGGIARPTSSSQPNMPPLQGSNGPGGGALPDGNFVSVSNASASLASGSPVTPMLSGSAVPRALVALVTMQNVSKAGQLEKIFLGDETEYVQAGRQVDAMRAQFEQGQYLKESFGFDENTFRFLAKHYLLFPEAPNAGKSGSSGGGGSADPVVTHIGVSFAQLCAHNALAAFVTGNAHLCQMWRILEVLYANEESAAGTKTHAGDRASGTADPRSTSKHYSDEFSPGGSPVGMPMDGDGDDQSHDMSPDDSNHDGQMDEFVQREEGQASDEYGDESYDHGTHNHSSNANETTMLLEQLDHVNPQAMEGFDPYPYDPRGRLANESGREGGDRNGASGVSNARGNSSMIMNGSAVMGDLGHLRDDVLKELLEYYTEIGDLQSCVAIAVVVGKVTSVEKVMGKAWLQHIYMHYIDLLHQLQIYTTANELVANCSDQSIRQMNMVRHVLLTCPTSSAADVCSVSCCRSPPACISTVRDAPSRSSRPAPASMACRFLSAEAAAMLPRCVPSGMCVIDLLHWCQESFSRDACCCSQLPVRGLYVWCPVCAHGGHLDHLTEWFARETVCPTGCSHHCSLSLVDAGMQTEG
jgi:hypothetical protein